MIVEHRFAHIPQDARRARAWVASHAPLAEVRLDPATTVPLGAFHRYHHLGEAVLTAYETPAQTIERTDRLVASQCLDHIVLRTPASGRARVEAGPRVGEAGPGDVVLIDLARPVLIEAGASPGVSLVVPRRRLADRALDVHVPHGRIMTGEMHPLARLLAGHLLHLTACLPAASPDQTRLLVAATLDLCRALATSAVEHDGVAPEETPEADIAIAMRRFIEDNLERVDVPMLMVRFGLSRRSLYRRFAADEGIHGYIRERRLVAAMRRLSRTRDGRPEKLARLGGPDPAGLHQEHDQHPRYRRLEPHQRRHERGGGQLPGAVDAPVARHLGAVARQHRPAGHPPAPALIPAARHGLGTMPGPTLPSPIRDAS